MNTQIYDPMGQAMQALQVLGNRRAQQQGFQTDQQRLALEAQRMAQQGDQFDRGLGMEERGLEQRGSQFDQQHAFQQAVQQYTQGRNAQMDPLEMARMQAQTKGMQIGNEQAPAELQLKQLQAAVQAGQLTAEQARQAFMEKHYGQQDQRMQDDMLLNYAQSLTPGFDPATGQMIQNPMGQQIIAEVMKRYLQGLPQVTPAGPPPVQFNAPNQQ